jgi:hypothetical protein
MTLTISLWCGVASETLAAHDVGTGRGVGVGVGDGVGVGVGVGVDVGIALAAPATSGAALVGAVAVVTGGDTAAVGLAGARDVGALALGFADPVPVLAGRACPEGADGNAPEVTLPTFVDFFGIPTTMTAITASRTMQTAPNTRVLRTR